MECAAVGMPAGVGSPMMNGLENIISQLVFAIPAVKGIEFGNGFGCADLFGSENKDKFAMRDGKVVTLTNNHGGILGGISSGMPIIFLAAFKPTPSISRPQKSVDFKDMTEQELVIKGRQAEILPDDLSRGQARSRLHKETYSALTGGFPQVSRELFRR